MEAKVLIEALRCAASVECKCHEDCPYNRLVELKREMLLPPDKADDDGKIIWTSCYCDAINLDAADWIEKHFAGWISVKERLPEVKRGRVKGFRESDPVLVYLFDGEYCVGKYNVEDDGERYWYDPFDMSEIPDVTHWMPLPEKPEETECIE